MKTIYAILRWPWTPWVDVCTFNHGLSSYLVQGRTSLITGRRVFRCTACDGYRWWKSPYSASVDQKVLERAGMFEQPGDRISVDTSIRFTK